MRWLLFGLVIIFLVLQFRLWVGKGSLAEVATLEAELAVQEKEIQHLKARNDELQAEVNSLKEGLEAIEEHARANLGMIKDDEIFFQITGQGAASGQ